ncbi:hypothetical protein PILCRDRAFT_827445 [Piloderma croceum F 1598]|uniref:Uncharacterized protein n=1 Tax=Piloderma croceum (strain F 1598) TaxID=765440 RepID=A0A0C3BD48_PILCF|nr:hypothetical protein PILCRDRAFT_827445 [Piloderma croceum F 1598]
MAWYVASEYIADRNSSQNKFRSKVQIYREMESIARKKCEAGSWYEKGEQLNQKYARISKKKLKS